MSRIVFDQPVWWRQPKWQLASAAVLSLVALVIWWAALSPPDHDPIVVRAPPATAEPATRRATAPPPAAPAPALPTAVLPVAEPPPGTHGPIATAPAPVSTAVAPGVHVTPLGLPPGVLQIPPEQPAEDNLEN